MLSYTPSFRYEREAASSAVVAAAAAATGEEAAKKRQRRTLKQFTSKTIETEMETRRAATTVGQDEMAAKPALRGASGGDNRGGGGALYLQPAVAGGADPDGGASVGCTEASTASPPQDAVLVNIRPVGPVSLLLTPG